MLKKLYLIFLLSIVLISTLTAEQLSVLTDSSTAKIFVNKQLKATGNLINDTFLPGTYLVEVFQDDILIYNQIATIEQAKNKTIYINVSEISLTKDIPNIQQNYQQATYVAQQKGNVGFGFNYDYAGISGLQFSLDQQSLSNQFVFWITNKSDYEISQIHYRLVTYFNSKLTSSRNWIIRPYAGIGGGYSTESSNSYSTEKVVFEIPFGFQFSRLKSNATKEKRSWTAPQVIAAIYFWPFTVVSVIFDKLSGTTSNSVYFHIETGFNFIDMTSNDPDAWQDYSGLKFATGTTYFF